MKHAGGVIITDKEFTANSAIMTTNKDEFISQYELHDVELMGLVKIDLLAVEALDRIRACLDLLIQANLVVKESTLFDTYQKTIGVYNLERDNIDMWKMVWENKIISLFQMEQSSGIQAIQLTLPTSVEDLAVINSVMRLMPSEKGAEQPLNKYARFKENPTFWEEEMHIAGLVEEERQIIRYYLNYEYGICAMQEDIMLLVQVPEIGGFSTGWADKLRKAIAKKSPKDYEICKIEFFENMEIKQLSYTLCHYVWDILVQTQRGYAFSSAHTLAYSLIALQEMNLAYKYPTLFWSTANIIADSGATDLIDKNEDEIGYIEEDSEDEDGEEDTPKVTVVDYARIAKAIGRIKSYNVSIHLPDINKSKFTFFPNMEENSIYYGLKGIAKINGKLVEEIIVNRPYNSFEDFRSKIKLTKPQMVHLIKSGAFDNFNDRTTLMTQYIYDISDAKHRLTLQNMQMLIAQDLLPESVALDVRVFNFNKYIKKTKVGNLYGLDTAAYAFYEKFFDVDLLDFSGATSTNLCYINQKTWDKIYDKYMNKMRAFLKENETELLLKLNTNLSQVNIDKYAQGNISKWEMDSVSFYFHEHELSNLQNDFYQISNFFALDEIPTEEYNFQTANGYMVSVNKIYRIAGTVLGKDKAKHTVTILTNDGVVTVKIYDATFAKYDKQVSELQPNGKKKVIEKSWFSRGNKLIFTGIRKGNHFVPKLYKKSEWKEPILLITNIDEKGFIETKNQREGE